MQRIGLFYYLSTKKRNMLRKEDLKTGLLNVRGWRPSYLVGQEIEEDLTTSDSGLYYQQTHALVTLETALAVAPRFDLQQFQTYTTGQKKEGSIFSHSGTNWIAINDTTDTPSVGSSDWEEWTEVKARSRWLRDLTQGAALSVISSIYANKVADKTAQEILANTSLYTDPVSNTNLIVNQGHLVGLELEPARAKGVSLKINAIGLTFATPAEAITLYIFHTSRPEAIKTITVDRTIVNGNQWYKPTEEIILPFENNDLGPGGVWMLVYDQSTITAQAINTIPETFNPQCFGNHLAVRPFKFTGSFSGTLWDIDDNNYTPSENYGLNIQASVYCDPTDLFLEQKLLFERVISLQVACTVLRELAYNPHAKLTRETLNLDPRYILRELDGDDKQYGRNGLGYQLEKEKKALHLSLDGLSPVCFKRKQRKIKIRTA